MVQTAGNYDLTVTDANGCSVVNSATVADGAAISVSITANNTICSGTSTGSLSAMVNLGQAPSLVIMI